MKVYELLKSNGFIVEKLNEEVEYLICNDKCEYFLDFLNDKGFRSLQTNNRLGSKEEFDYEYGNDELYSGRVKIILKKDFTDRLHLNFECKKSEK